MIGTRATTPQRGRRRHERHDIGGPRRFAEHGDGCRITSECGDVAVNPGERRELVKQAEVRRRTTRSFARLELAA